MQACAAASGQDAEGKSVLQVMHKIAKGKPFLQIVVW